MGLIAARPEEPQDWAGIPSEPEDTTGKAEHLDKPPVTASDPFALLAASPGGSIAIPITSAAAEPVPDAVDAPRD